MNETGRRGKGESEKEGWECGWRAWMVGITIFLKMKFVFLKKSLK